MSDQVAEMSATYLVEAAQDAVPVGYKQTEIGIIPADWEIEKLGNLVDISSGESPSKFQFLSEGVPYFKVEQLNNDSVYAEATSYFIATSKAIPAGSIIFPKRGASILSNKIRILKNDSFMDTNLMTLTCSQCLNEFYLYNQLNYKGLDSVADTTSIPQINNKHIYPYTIPLPSKVEQTAIANALSDVDALISELEKLTAKKQAIKTATMQQLLTGRTRLPQFSLREDGMPKGYKQSELGEIPEDWKFITLGKLVTFLKGSGLPKSELVEDGLSPCIHYGQLFTTYGPKIENILSKTNSPGGVKSEANDILMPTSDVTPNGLATASSITESEVILGGDILIIRGDKKSLNGVFFSYLINVMHHQVMQLVTGSTVYHLYGSDMKKFCLALPSIVEQTAIATILSEMDDEIQTLEQRLGKTRQIKQGMMQELLTGKTRLVAPAA